MLCLRQSVAARATHSLNLTSVLFLSTADDLGLQYLAKSDFPWAFVFCFCVVVESGHVAKLDCLVDDVVFGPYLLQSENLPVRLGVQPTIQSGLKLI